MKKIYFSLVFFLLICSSAVFSQEMNVETEAEAEVSVVEEDSEDKTVIDENLIDERSYVDEKSMTVTEVEELIQSQALIHQVDFVFGITPTVILNTHTKSPEGKYISAPSPIVTPVYIGIAIPNFTTIYTLPSVKIFTDYSLVYGERVLPAEVENRTAVTYSILFNLPVILKLRYQDKFSWSVSGGLAGLFRIAAVPSAVKEDETGYLGTVKDDVNYMNKWYYQNLRYLYVSAGLDWMFYYGKTKFGPDFSVYLPVSIFSDKSFDSIMISAGVKVEF